MSFKIVKTVEFPQITYDSKALRRVSAELIEIPCVTEEEIMAAVADADAIITITSRQPFSRKMLGKLTNCRLIASIGIGYESVDVEAATEYGICVTNTPDYCLEEVSDHAMALLLACARRLFPLDKAVREGKWDTPLRPAIRQIWEGMPRLRGQTLGLFGFGRIARTLALKAQCLGIRVIAYDPYIHSDVAVKMGVELVEFDRLLEGSDYISIHAALTPETMEMFGVEQFRRMKPTAYLINTSRGGIVDEVALYSALYRNEIAGAALDVMAYEPPDPGNPLLKSNNVIITAHSGHASDTATKELSATPARQVIQLLEGKWPHALVNPQVKEQFESKWGKMQEDNPPS